MLDNGRAGMIEKCEIQARTVRTGVGVSPKEGMTRRRDGHTVPRAEFPFESNQSPDYYPLKGRHSLWLRGARSVPKAKLLFVFFK